MQPMTLISTKLFAQIARLLMANAEKHPLAIEGEKQLVKSAKQGNPDAFTDLYNHYFPKVYAFVMRRTGHQQIAEDLTSQIFLKAFAKLPKFNITSAPFGAWLFRIATNTVTDHYRKSSTNKEFSAEVLPEKIDLSQDADELIIENEAKELVLSLVAKLPKKDQEIIQLRFLAELGVKEISAIVELSPNVVSVRIYRALKKLSQHANDLGIKTV